MAFPQDFVWGAASASYQVEGAAFEDGRGWDVTCRQPGKTWEGDTGEVACDHYHRFPEDVQLVSETELPAGRHQFGYRGGSNWAGVRRFDRPTSLQRGWGPA